MSAPTTAREARGLHRKWSARLELSGGAAGASEMLDAQPCRWDTLAEVSKAAIAEAAEYLRAGLALEARVILDKRLAAWPEPREDRQTAYLWLEQGQVYIQR
jgi:hypothetical protein